MEEKEQDNNAPENQPKNEEQNQNNQENAQEKVQENVQENAQENNQDNNTQENKQENNQNEEEKEQENPQQNIAEEVLDQNNIPKNENQENENKKLENEENKNVINENPEQKVEEKGEALKIETPDSSIKDNEETISTIKSKIKELKNNYNFYIHYHDILFKIIRNLEDLTYEKITNSVQDSFNYLSFFKNSSELYSKFAEQIKNSNKIITSPIEKPKMNDNFLSEVMQTTQNIFYQNLLKFSTGLKTNIIAKGPLSKLHEKTNKIEIIKKVHFKKFNIIIEKKKKFEKKYNSFQKLFDSFLPEENNNINNDNKSNDNNNIVNNNIINKIPKLVDSPDFVYIIKDLLEGINKLILGINLFIIETKDALLSINNLFVEINNLVKESILIYIQESKIFFGVDVIKKFEEIENYFKKLDEEQKDNSFKLDKIFSEQKNKEDIFNLLQQYYDLLNNSDKVKKELISDKNTFSINNYSNIILFFEWLISISPQPTDISVDDLIVKKLEIKRDPGIFSRWRNEVMVFTKQHHLILFDKPNSFLIENLVKIFEIDKITYRRKEDNKKPFLFEILANTKGKVMNFKGSFLFDGLNNENFTEISNSVPKEVINK